MSSTSDTNKIIASKRTPGAIPVQVIRHEVIVPNVVTLSLAQPGTRQAPGPYLPGQFITLVIPGRDGNTYRSYSLCGDGHARDPWEITLKRIPGGVVSNYLYDNVTVGTILYTLPPRGAFILPASLRPEQTLVFVAIGSGITPIRGFIRAIATLPPASRPKVQLHYASRSPQETIYRDELLKLDWLHQKYYLRTEGPRMTLPQIFTNAYPLSRDAQWYICGPEAFDLEVRDTLLQLGVPEDFIHFEIFADQSRQHLAAAASREVVGQVTIKETGATIEIRAQETLLEALERHDYQPEFGCRVGTCGTCQLHVLQGQVNNPGKNFLTTGELRSGTVLGCITQPQGNITIESGGIPPRGTPVIGHNVTQRRARQKYGLRVAAAVVIGIMTVSLWQLTDHKASATTANSTSTPTTIPTVAPTATPTAIATATTTATTTTAPTPTPIPTQAPTPTPTTKTGSS
jgi:ring-1,2-phenylacetyl-CoA epoxidase subunit PaaE